MPLEAESAGPTDGWGLRILLGAPSSRRGATAEALDGISAKLRKRRPMGLTC